MSKRKYDFIAVRLYQVPVGYQIHMVNNIDESHLGGVDLPTANLKEAKKAWTRIAKEAQIEFPDKEIRLEGPFRYNQR